MSAGVFEEKNERGQKKAYIYMTGGRKDFFKVIEPFHLLDTPTTNAIENLAADAEQNRTEQSQNRND